MASFPALFSGVVSLYPLTQASRRPCTVLEYSDYTEQRWRRSATLARFVLTFDKIAKPDNDVLRTFFDTMKGGFDHTWDITVGGTTYQNMVFEVDSYNDRNDEANHWTVSLPCRQVRKN